MSAVVTSLHSPAPLQHGVLGRLLANFDGLVYRCLADRNWTMQYASDGCLKLTGYKPEELIANAGVNFEDLTHPDDRCRVRQAIHAALRINERYSLEYRIVRRDGAVRWVWERGIGVRDVHNAGGAHVALEGYIVDITQRKQAEQALHEAERRWRSIFENAVEGIFQSTPDKGYLAVNPALARIYGYDSPQQMTETLRDIDRQLYVDPQRRAEFLHRMAEHDSVINFESQVYQRNGGIIWISENARVVRGAGNDILFFEGTVVDITSLAADHARIDAGPQGLRLGGLAKMSDAADHPAVLKDYPVIAQSLQLAASAQLRNMATLGGNVLHPSGPPAKASASAGMSPRRSRSGGSFTVKTERRK